MKPILLFLLFLLAGKSLSAQDIAYKKDKPVQLTYFKWGDLGEWSDWYVKKLKKEGFSERDAQAIMQKASQRKGFPPATEKDFGNNTAVLSHYKAYQQYYISRMGFKYALVWFPYVENKHMPEALQPTDKEGFVILLEARGLSENGKDAAGNALAIAGTPVPASQLAAAAGTLNANGNGGTTAGGIQYSSADMSAFSKPMLGCMAYVNSDKSLMYVVPIRGKEVTNPGATAAAAFRFAVVGGSYTKYEWLPGVDAKTVIERFKDNMTVSQQRTYTMD